MVPRIRRSVRSLRPTALAVLVALAACGGGSGGGSSTGTIEESGSMAESADPNFWVNSGGRLVLGNGFGHTVEGELASDDPWRVAYSRSSSTDTDGGYHPQNLFRLVTRHPYGDFTQTLTFTIRRVNRSASSNRNQSNGVLLFEHYLDGDNLYYAGVRVDGNAVIKKKLRGTYTTLGLVPVFPGSYDRARNPNLIPENRPVTIQTVTHTNADRSVEIALFVDGNPALDVRDGGTGGSPISSPGFAGIRTDFMDVEFDDYSAG